jgi:hypothetical protein
VRSPEEILATLDEYGQLDSLPFMPEMFDLCGKRFTVGKIANKVCDTISKSGMRRMHDAVHLADVRCDGSGHDGCQAGCLMYWKTAWLKPVDESVDAGASVSAALADPAGRKLLTLITENSRKTGPDGDESYVCQPTELLRAAPERLPWKQFGQFVEDVRIGNATASFSARAFMADTFNRVQYVSRKLPRRLRVRHGLQWPFLQGGLTGATPNEESNLQPGEWVRIKSREEIEATLNQDLKNRGLGFDAEMVRFCGRTARVSRRVTRIIEEPSGKMIEMKYPCIVLDGIICEGAYNASCPRGIPAYWREIWLERVPAPANAAG